MPRSSRRSVPGHGARSTASRPKVHADEAARGEAFLHGAQLVLVRQRLLRAPAKCLLNAAPRRDRVGLAWRRHARGSRLRAPGTRPGPSARSYSPSSRLLARPFQSRAREAQPAVLEAAGLSRAFDSAAAPAPRPPRSFAGGRAQPGSAMSSTRAASRSRSAREQLRRPSRGRHRWGRRAAPRDAGFGGRSTRGVEGEVGMVGCPGIRKREGRPHSALMRAARTSWP